MTVTSIHLGTRNSLVAGLTALAVVGLFGCDQAASATDAGGGAPDASAPAAVCCRAERVEDCRGCYAKLGQCCYGDIALQGMAPLLVRNCEGTPGCRACCNECKALSCAEHKARGNCPNLIKP